MAFPRCRSFLKRDPHGQNRRNFHKAKPLRSLKLTKTQTHTKGVTVDLKKPTPRTRAAPEMPSQDQHGIPVTVKSIRLFDGPVIGVSNQLHACKSGHEKQERRFGQVKVGNQSIDHAELKTRGDQKVRLAPASRNLSMDSCHGF
jgi:hypothetical protein